MPHYDAIVLGAGGIGSAALYELARRGVRAVGIDRFHPPHDRGSSHGQSRVIRQAYFEHADYVPLLLAAYLMWRELEQQSGQMLLHEIGLIQLGPADGVVVPGVLRSAADHNLNVESLSADDVRRRWPGLSVGDDLVGVYEPRGGYLLVEDCVRAHLAAAQAAGADLRFGTEIVGWKANDREVRVQTATEEIAADRLIVTAGAWAASVLTDLRLPLTVRRKSLFWFAVDGPDYDASNKFPVYLFDLPGGVFYGFPKLDPRGVKVGEHTGGHAVADPKTVDRSIDLAERLSTEKFLHAHLPAASARVTDHSVCLYTMSPDEHFIVDRHPAYANVAFAAGLSGHGFKFAPVLGRALADLALDGVTSLPIEFLSLARF
jgi:monomeric sarcosine oxidase